MVKSLWCCGPAIFQLSPSFWSMSAASAGDAPENLLVWARHHLLHKPMFNSLQSLLSLFSYLSRATASPGKWLFVSGCCCLQEGSGPALPKGQAGAEAPSLSKSTREVPKGFVKGCLPLESHREVKKTEGIKLRVRAKHLQEMGAWIYLISHD